MINFPLHSKPKLDIIAHSLTRCGIPLWHGMPEQIIKDLYDAGYKIKKRKKFKNLTQPSVASKHVLLKPQYDSDKDIYL